MIPDHLVFKMFRPETQHFSLRITPVVVFQSRFSAKLSKSGFHIPTLLRGNFRKKKCGIAFQTQANPVSPELNLLPEL